MILNEVLIPMQDDPERQKLGLADCGGAPQQMPDTHFFGKSVLERQVPPSPGRTGYISY